MNVKAGRRGYGDGGCSDCKRGAFACAEESVDWIHSQALREAWRALVVTGRAPVSWRLLLRSQT